MRDQLRHSGEPLSRSALRERLRVNNARLGLTLAHLEQAGLVSRTPAGWTLPAQPNPRQLNLVD